MNSRCPTRTRRWFASAGEADSYTEADAGFAQPPPEPRVTAPDACRRASLRVVSGCPSCLAA
jgi:hypothetical protein